MIELRPLSLGELLDRTFSYYRSHFLLFVGIMVLPQAAIVGVALLIQALQLTNFPPVLPNDPARIQAAFPALYRGILLGAGLTILVYIFVYSIALGAASYALSEVHLGREASIAGAYRSLKGRLWRLFDVVGSVILRVIGLYILMGVGVLLVVLALGALQRVSGDPGAAVLALIVALLGVPAGILLVAAAAMRYAVAVPALVLENIRPREAVKRSVALMKGNIWRVFLITLLMCIIAVVVASIFQGPFWLALMLFGFKHPGVAPLWLRIPMAISGGFGGALSGPLIVIALTLLYYDARVRKEGFDLQLMMAGLDRSGSDAIGPIVLPAPPAGSSV